MDLLGDLGLTASTLIAAAVSYLAAAFVVRASVSFFGNRLFGRGHWYRLWGIVPWLVLIGAAALLNCFGALLEDAWISIWGKLIAGKDALLGFLRQAFGGLPQALIAIAAVLGLLLSAIKVSGTRSRRKTLMQGAVELKPLSEPAPATGRRIVLCCDGTGNTPDQIREGKGAPTNIWKIYQALVKNEQQVAWYDPGVATASSKTARSLGRVERFVADVVRVPVVAQILAFASRILRVIEGVTGSGIDENVVEAYTELARLYRPGDQIYLFGFSRGAWTVRCLAGLIQRCGVLKPENLRYGADIVALHRARKNPSDPMVLAPGFTDPSARVAFMGVFDTVASLGVPLWGWWFKFWPHWEVMPTTPMPVCERIYHALAMDERRAQFFPTLFQPLPNKDAVHPRPHVEQVWFRGAHSDVGGGYPETELSDIPLKWMLQHASDHGLAFDQSKIDALKPDLLGRIHDELARAPGWRLLGSWPRWHPASRFPGSPTDEFGALHECVFARAKVMEQELGRPDLKHLVDEGSGASVEIAVPGRLQWFRTGIVLESGRKYKITWLDGEWRDKECKLCGPAGQKAGPGLDIVRRLWGFRRRAWPSRRETDWPQAKWMTLVATIAHPRTWDVKEYGLRKLFRHLFWREPRKLLRQLAPIGIDLTAENRAIRIENRARDGMLWLFANDTWVTDCNNSGAIRLRIEAVAGDWQGADASLPLWIANQRGQAEGDWVREVP